MNINLPSHKRKVKENNAGEPECYCTMRLTYIYFFIAVTQGSHDFRFDMGRMGIRAGKLTSPEFFDKEVMVLLVRNMCESFDKNGKTKCAHKCFTQSKGFIL